MDIRIPLLIRGPGLPAKKLISQPVLNIDFAPTFLDMAGLEAPSWMDGTSFLPLLEDIGNYEKDENRTFLIEYHGEGSNTTISPDCPFHSDNTLSVSKEILESRMIIQSHPITTPAYRLLLLAALAYPLPA